MVRQVVGAIGVARGRRAAVLTVVVVLALAGVAVAAGSVKFDGSPRTGAPPSKLDGAKMQKFKPDRRPRFKQVSDVTGPTGQITFSGGVFHLVVKNLNKKGYWRTWSNRLPRRRLLRPAAIDHDHATRRKPPLSTSTSSRTTPACSP